MGNQIRWDTASGRGGVRAAGVGAAMRGMGAKKQGGVRDKAAGESAARVREGTGIGDFVES